ncbi:MAG: PilZ domain-containing protein [Clostridia bacterium]|nr:PilZ domain-containing protein [Clostridia bacterium]
MVPVNKNFAQNNKVFTGNTPCSINITKGTVISIKHPLLFEPVLTVVQKTEGNNVFFRIPDTFLKYNIFKGDQITIQTLQDNYEYVIQGMISDIELQYPRQVQVSIDKVDRYKNKRKSKRYLTNLQANISSADISRNLYAIVKNISDSGVSAVIREQLDTDSIVVMSICIPDNGLLEFKAKIIRNTRKANYYEYGMEIIKIDEGNKSLLSKLIASLNKNEKEYISECLR